MNHQPVRGGRPLLLLLLPLLAALAAAAIALSGRPGPTPEPTPAAVILPTAPPPRQLAGEPAPDFSLRTLDDTTVRLSDFRGRPVFLNFWATWCAPCERELPAFAAFMREQPADGPVVLAVNLGETYDQVDAFLTDRGIAGFPVLLDVRYEVAALYAVGPIPVTFAIDESGVIRFAKYGEMTRQDLSDYLAALHP